MDRVEFACSIHNLTSDDIMYRFDELMTLYNVLDHRTGYTITNTSTDITSFSIDFVDCKSADAFNKVIENTTFPIYNHVFLIQTKLIRNMLHVELIKQK